MWSAEMRRTEKLTVATSIVIVIVSLPANFASAAVTNDCGDLAEGEWLAAEKLAWKKICKGQPVNFNQERGYGGIIDPTNEDLWRDSTRLIGRDFLQQILTQPPFGDILKDKVIDISGAYFSDILKLENTVTRAFILSNSRFIESVVISNIDVKFIGFRKNFIGGSFQLQLGNAREFDFDQNVVHCAVTIKSSTFDMVNCASSSQRLDVQDLRSSLLFCCSNVNRTLINRSKIDNLCTFGSDGASSLQFIDSSAGSLSLYGNWLNGSESELDLHNSNISRIVNLGSYPSKVRVENLDFRTWSIKGNPDDKPQALIDKIDGSKIDLLQKLSDQYRRQGDFAVADDLLYQKRDEEAGNTSGVNKILGWMSWGIVGYGVKLQNGVICIGILTLIGYLVFRNGERYLESEVKPRSWLIFSVDSIIPGINLDDDHKKVRFMGWRQYYLYLLKTLGILLFFLVFRYISQSITGSL
jgi:hypothetical protein